MKPKLNNYIGETLCKCLAPKRIYNKYSGKYLYLPCRKCDACLQKRASILRHRIESEMEFSACTLFFTLTYSDKNIPMASVCNYKDTFGKDRCKVTYPSGVEIIHPCRIDKDFPVLFKRDIQLFLKRYRKQIAKEFNNEKIRYYIIGEYSPEKKRPHYHGLIFFKNSFQKSRKAQMLREAWSNGYTDTQYCTSSVVSYVSSYCDLSSNINLSFCDKQNAAFATWSRRPPLGFSHKDDNTILHVHSQSSPEVYEPRKGSFGLLPSYVQDRAFPRLPDYAQFSSTQRTELYEFISQYSTSVFPYLPPEIFGRCFVRLKSRTVTFFFRFRDGTCYERVFSKQSWRSYGTLFKRLRLLLSKFKPSDVEMNISQYYSRLEGLMLKSQLLMQDAYVKKGGSVVDLIHLDMELCYKLLCSGEIENSFPYQTLKSFGFDFEFQKETFSSYFDLSDYRLLAELCSSRLKKSRRRKTHNDHINLFSRTN